MSVLGNWVQKLPRTPRRQIERVRLAAMTIAALRGVHARTCSICGYQGKFRAFLLTLDAQCPKCDSLSRHRLFEIVDRKYGVLSQVNSMVHFAPEEILSSKFAKMFPTYKTADLFRDDVDFKVNIEDTGLPDECFEAAFVSHVLEHVDDEKALGEIHRILKTDGILIAMVPIVEGWAHTYEDRSIDCERERDLHFGQKDHVRFYGRDFVDRLGARFEVTEFVATPEECVAYGLERGEKVFLARKRSAARAH